MLREALSVRFWCSVGVVLSLALLSSNLQSQAITPTLTALNPAYVGVGAGATTVNANGTGFDSSTVVLANGNALQTTFIAGTALQFVLPATLVNTVGPVQIAV